MKKSQFITIFILLIVASVIICIGCFIDDPKDKSNETPSPSSAVDILPTMKPLETEPVAEETPEPGATEEPVETGTKDPASKTPLPSIPFPNISNLGFARYDNTFDHFSTKWVTGENNQNKAVILDTVLEKIKDIDYVFYTVESETEWNHYMTFVLHWETGYTGELLDLLKKYDVKAVFFVTKMYIEKNPDLVRRMKEEGHIIGSRGQIADGGEMTEAKLKEQTAEEFYQGLLGVEKAYQDLFGSTERMYLYRPDYFSERTLKVAEAAGYTVVFRTYTYYSDAAEYQNKSVEELVIRFNARAAYNGSVSEFIPEKKCIDALEGFIKNCIDQKINFKLVERRH